MCICMSLDNTLHLLLLVTMNVSSSQAKDHAGKACTVSVVDSLVAISKI
jgi:hypothetical protein